MAASSTPKKQFLSNLDNSLFMCAKTQEIALRLFCRHEKEISFGSGKITFSERHNRKLLQGCFDAKKTRLHSVSENSLFENEKRREFLVVCFGAMESDLFQIPKIRFLRSKKALNHVKVVLALRKSDFFRIREKFAFTFFEHYVFETCRGV